MEMALLLSINNHLTILRDGEGAVMVNRVWRREIERIKIDHCSEFSVTVGLNHTCSAAIRDLTHFRLSSSHYSPAANNNSYLAEWWSWDLNKLHALLGAMRIDVLTDLMNALHFICYT